MMKPRMAVAALLALSGCGPKKVDPRPIVEMDQQSGPDGKRSGAMRVPVNQIVTDEVNYDKQDMTDWKSVDLRGKPGILTVEIHWDNPNSDLNIDAFDGFGSQIASSPGPSPGAQVKKLVMQIDQVGVYYLRIQAPKPHDGSVYTMEAHWNEPAPEEPKVAVRDPEPDPPAPKPERNHSKREHTPPAPRPVKVKFEPETGVQGRIVSSYREGAQMVLHIDKGSAAGVHVGQSGTILDGPTSANALDGGSFTITQVIDDSKCIAKTNLRSIGRNNRVSINTSK